MSATLHTSLGDMKLELATVEVPSLCANFLALAASGAYDGTLFHRNIKGFLLQGGDPTGTGKGGAALLLPPGLPPGSPLPPAHHPLLRHDARGILAMASSDKAGIGAQFYLTYAAQETLDGVYCVMGRLIGGWDVLDAMERAPVAGKRFKPVTDIVLRSVTIHANPLAA